MQKGKKPRPQAVRPRRTLLPFPEPLEARRFLSASACGIAQPALTVAAGSIQGYTPAQIRQAYGADQVPANGQGQTIAIVDAYNDPKIKSDLDVFDAQFGLSAPPSFNVVSQTGGSVGKISTDPAWSMETALDVEWAHAIAPGANILLVEAKDSSQADLLAAVNYASNVAGVSVISMNWGGGEFPSNLFSASGTHTGVTFVGAVSGQGDFPGAEQSASPPDVPSGGGTTMQPSDIVGEDHHETSWVKTTGGKHRQVAYQRMAQPTGSQLRPDVAIDANPDTGYAIYDSVRNNGKSGWQTVDGASAAAPQWGALIAVADQLRVAADLGTLNGAIPALPVMHLPPANASTSSANSSQISAAFSRTHGGTAAGSDAGVESPRPAGLIEALVHEASGDLLSPAFTLGGSATGAVVIRETAALGIAPSLATALQAPPPGATFASAPATIQSPPALATAPGQTLAVFNEVPIHHPEASALSVPGPGRIELRDAAESQRGGALALANATAFAGELSAALASWLAGSNLDASDSNDLAFGMGHESVAGAISAGFPIATGAISPAEVIAAISAPLVHGPAGILYRFANFDPVSTFADSLADFARESASIGPMEMKHSSHRALIVTMVVIGVDTMLAANWYNQRKKAQKQATATNPESPQAGPLPTGL